jgi:gas vesicle structural protein
MAALFLRVAGLPIIMSTPGTLVFSNTSGDDQASLVGILDHVLNQGVILRGNLIISLAGVDLVYVGLDVILTSVETALRHIAATSKPPAKAT